MMIKNVERKEDGSTVLTVMNPDGTTKRVTVRMSMGGASIKPNLKQFAEHEEAMSRLFTVASEKWGVSRKVRYTVHLSPRTIQKIWNLPSKKCRFLLRKAVETKVLNKIPKVSTMRRPLYSVPRRYLL